MTGEAAGEAAGEELFLAAREATNRSALTRYKQAQGVDEDDAPAVRTAEDRFHELPLLLDPALCTFAYNALSEARGPLIYGSRRFPATLWLGGATDTEDGRDFLGDIAGVVKLLQERATKLAGKRDGWVIEPTTNVDGHRTNASTKAMHAVFLDCDSRGEWHQLLAALNQLNYCYIAYQSGGWTPTTPKWRIVLPLSEPFDTSDEAKRELWKIVYNHLRVVVGAVAGLRGEGFDPATETPCCPWFLTERRQEADPPREVHWYEGHALDLMALVMALPSVEVEQPQKYAARAVETRGLSDEKLHQLIDTLARVTANVPSGRHDLYLALPGVLLDRGVPADEVLAIIEAVSASYPRVHHDKHKDNLHNAKTTIGKWESGGAVTRIGTLNERWPEIAQALDDVLPNPLNAALRASTDALIADKPAPTVSAPVTPENPSERKRRRRLGPLGKELVPMVRSMKQSAKGYLKRKGLLVERILDGESFEIKGATHEDVDNLVNDAMESIGYSCPNATWQEVLDLANVTLCSMEFVQSGARVEASRQAFLKGQRTRRKKIKKQNAKIDEDRQHSGDLLNAAAAAAAAMKRKS